MRLVLRIGFLLAGWHFALLCSGCAAPSSGQTPETPRVMDGAGVSERVTSAELDELTRAFADRYVGLLYSVCDAIKKDNPDPAQRREVQALLLDCSTNVYDIASNADAFTRVLDLVVVTSLLSQVWVDDGRAMAVFGERGEPLVRGMVRAQEETRALAVKVLTAEQLAVVDSLIDDWRAENPEMTAVSFVRFSNFAIGRGRTAASEVLAARGFFAEVGHAGQAVDEVRHLSERVFYRLKREPTLIRWQIEAMKDDFMATPETAAALANLNRLTDQIEQLPAAIAAERQALLAGLDDSLKSADATIANLSTALDKGRDLIASLEPAAQSLGETLEIGSTFFGQFDEWDRWKTEVRPRPFDIREQTESLKELATAAERLNEMLTTSSTLLGSPDWSMRLEEASESADGRITLMADQSRSVLNAFFWRAAALMAVLFILLILYRLVSFMLMKRLEVAEGPRVKS
jgi:hypothetical protein